MPRSHPHSGKGRGQGERPQADAGAPDDDLRRQVALLAEQVSRLGRAAAVDPPSPSPRYAPAQQSEPTAEPPPRARTSAVQLPSEQGAPPAGRPDPVHATARIDLAFAGHAPDRRPVAETVQVDQFVSESSGRPGAVAAGAVNPAAAGSAPVAQPEHAPGEGESFAERSSRLVESVVALAELAAIEIRASAEFEAAAIRARSQERLSSPATAKMLALVERQRRMLDALAAETARLEQAGAVIRAQIRALEAEHEYLSEIVASRSRTP